MSATTESNDRSENDDADGDDDQVDGYNPEWASAVDDRGNVFYVEPSTASSGANSRSNLYSTPVGPSQRRARRSLSPSVSLSYSLGLAANVRRPESGNATSTSAAVGTSKRAHGDGEKRSKLKTMWKNLTGQKRGHHSGNTPEEPIETVPEGAMASSEYSPRRAARAANTTSAATSMSQLTAVDSARGEQASSSNALDAPARQHVVQKVILKVPVGFGNDTSPNLRAFGIATDTKQRVRKVDVAAKSTSMSQMDDNSAVIFITGILPDSPASIGPVRMQPGDEIHQINGVNVSARNITTILAAVAHYKEIVIKVQGERTVRGGKMTSSLSNQQLLSLMKSRRTTSPYLTRTRDGTQYGTRSPNIAVKPKTAHHGLMYLTLDTKSSSKAEDSGMEDILYHYPQGSAAATAAANAAASAGGADEEMESPGNSAGQEVMWSPIDRLVQVRGVFLTLSDILQKVTGTSTSSSLLTVDGKPIHIGYLQLGDNLLVLMLPATSAPLFYLDCVMEDIDRLLTITFGSIHSAFTKKRHKDRLDQLFSLIFERLLTRDRDGYHHITDALHGIHRLPIPFDVQSKISSALSELEADDHSMLDEVLHMRRPFLILGSTLFYKGYLIESHLPEEDTQDLALYCRYYCLLQLSSRQRLGQLVIWHEIFLSRRGPFASDSQAEDPAYVEQTGRTFLLIVGHNHALMCVLLEAGATTAKIAGHPGPVPYYVDVAEEVLTTLNSRGLLQACDSRIQMAPVPAVITAQQALSTAAALQPALVKFAQQHGIKSALKDDAPDSDPGSGQSGSPGLSRAIFMQKAALPPGTASSGFRKSVKRYAGPKMSSQPAKPLASLAHSLTAGDSNILFHYINVDAVAGIMVCPLVQHIRAATAQTSTAAPSIHGQLVRSFHRTCIAIREVLCRRCMQEVPENQFSRQNALHGVYEHGVLLQINPSPTVDKALGRSSATMDKQRSSLAINYWVVGRLFREPVQREFYVCYQESMSQNVVELAFKLCFGAVT